MPDRIANPIYDSVFKFLMEDNRVALTLLSALLKKKVLKVEVRPHEFTDNVRNHLEDILNVFNQSYVSEESKHMLVVGGRAENPNEDIRYIYDRLAYAASNPDVRHEMDIEDEILGELENLDTTIAKQKQQLFQKDEQLALQAEEIRRLKELLNQK